MHYLHVISFKWELQKGIRKREQLNRLYFANDVSPYQAGNACRPNHSPLSVNTLRVVDLWAERCALQPETAGYGTDDLRNHAVSTSSFRQSLKTYLFSAYQHVQRIRDVSRNALCKVKHRRIQGGGQSGHAPHVVCQWDLPPQPSKILHEQIRLIQDYYIQLPVPEMIEVK